MNDIQLYSNEKFSVRTVQDTDGTVWFVAKDIAEALEYSLEGSITTLFANVPTIWAARKPIAVRSENGVVQERDMLCLTEQGVYFFLGRSDKPKALPYQMWIAGDVVPSIHATGSYSVRSDNHTLDIQLKTIDIERAKILQHIAAAPELYEVFRRVLEEIPIIAGDSRHDALSYAISDARQLLERIDREESFV